MSARKGFTLIELLVVISIIALLVAILLPALNKARDQAKAAVCLVHVKQLSIAWHMYAYANEGRLMNSEFSATGTKENWCLGPQNENGVSTLGMNCTLEDRKRGIRAGALYKYLDTTEIYHCPSDQRMTKNPPETAAYVSYSLPGGLNSSWEDWGICRVKLSEINKPAEKYNFVEEDARVAGTGAYKAFNAGNWSLAGRDWLFNEDAWGDPMAAWHNEGNVLGFCDGHAENHKWRDERTIEYFRTRDKSLAAVDTADLRWVIRGFAHKSKRQ